MNAGEGCLAGARQREGGQLKRFRGRRLQVPATAGRIKSSLRGIVPPDRSLTIEYPANGSFFRPQQLVSPELARAKADSSVLRSCRMQLSAIS
jgi:hypothetical protein